jgi:hypothetical protein
VRAYENALKERTRERVPLGWAMTQGNLANLELAFFEKTKDQSHLTQAMGYAEAAKQVFVESKASQYIEMVERQIAKIAALQNP